MERAIRRLTVVVPVYNEEESLAELHAEITAAMSALPGLFHEIIFVDDGSMDHSAGVLREIHAADPEHVRAIVFRRNFGQTAAMAAGFDAATGDVIVPMDADLQNDPADIARLLEKLEEGFDVVSGWRNKRRDGLLLRRLPSKAANGLISWITGVRLHDYGCTLKAYRREVAMHIDFYGEMHRFLPALASWSGAKVAEIPVNHRRRRFGVSKYGIGRTVGVVLDLMTVKFLMSYSTKPMQVFGKVVHGLSANRNGWTMLCVVFLITGMQFIGIGLLGEINVRTYYQSRNKPIYTVRERIGGE
jgi:glycosyltransferase involved in cell wall biosynthesis